MIPLTAGKSKFTFVTPEEEHGVFARISLEVSLITLLTLLSSLVQDESRKRLKQPINTAKRIFE